ncbi:2-pyrone-4,6-dicarboxylate lactonase [Rhodovulum iodosum]|uniref:2-pyrone-4,6-dicarboxylate lactonase n=1 Tax=Rhodovulum iodosum TaxID=68291 RepID=A0ABV3XTR8_9RHOB|nr:amidohydrolase family protein [Rhodovulum robiginosum]RSK32161.1 2-pyrone-4,6-dicarboxylate hydrolase [Rhodovulum robiginosum]
MRTCLPPRPPRRPGRTVPTGLIDAHCHIVGPADRFALAQGRAYTAPDAPLEQYLALREALGISRSVVVQPGAHGFDNAVTLDAIARMGESARGIAVVPLDVSEGVLADYDAGGIRGVRLSSMLRGASGTEGMQQLAHKIAPRGWHILFHLHDADEILELEKAIRASPVPIMLDHMARTTGDMGPGSAAFGCLLRLLEDCDHVWTKICSWYRLSSRPDWTDMAPLAQAVLDTAPDRVVWGSNWPHVMLFDGPVPDDAALLDQAIDWFGPHARQVLVDNPARLYFPGD